MSRLTSNILRPPQHVEVHTTVGANVHINPTRGKGASVEYQCATLLPVWLEGYAFAITANAHFFPQPIAAPTNQTELGVRHWRMTPLVMGGWVSEDYTKQFLYNKKCHEQADKTHQHATAVVQTLHHPVHPGPMSGRNATIAPANMG